MYITLFRCANTVHNSMTPNYMLQATAHHLKRSITLSVSPSSLKRGAMRVAYAVQSRLPNHSRSPGRGLSGIPILYASSKHDLITYLVQSSATGVQACISAGFESVATWKMAAIPAFLTSTGSQERPGQNIVTTLAQM